MNPVLSHHTCLAALSNQASIILEDGCGISGATLVCVNGIRIGRHTLIGPKVQLLTALHPFDATQRRTGLEAGRPITVGDDCWLGGGVIVCPGVAIGDRSVIGAGAVVTRDIPADSVAVGNPARVIRTLTRQDETE